MNKKKFLFEAIVIVLALAYYVIWIEIPELKKSMGSSDTFFDTNQYVSSLEVLIDGNTRFMYVFNQKNKVYSLFFLNYSSLCLYNQNIEGLSINDAFQKSISILKRYKCLTEKSDVIITSYSDVSDSIIQSFQDELYDTNHVTLKNSSLIELARSKNITEDEKDSILRTLWMDSLELAQDYS